MSGNIFARTWSHLVEVLSDKHGYLDFGYRKKADPTERYFPMPNHIFYLGLEGGEILVYAYLMYCEDRKTFKCHPSFTTIGEAVGMSKNTVKKYVDGLREKRLITTEPTMITTKDGRYHNGSLEYTVRPIREALDYYEEVQMRELEAEHRRIETQRRLEEYDRKRKETAV